MEDRPCVRFAPDGAKHMALLDWVQARAASQLATLVDDLEESQLRLGRLRRKWVHWRRFGLRLFHFQSERQKPLRPSARPMMMFLARRPEWPVRTARPVADSLAAL